MRSTPTQIRRVLLAQREEYCRRFQGCKNCDSLGVVPAPETPVRPHTKGHPPPYRHALPLQLGSSFSIWESQLPPGEKSLVQGILRQPADGPPKSVSAISSVAQRATHSPRGAVGKKTADRAAEKATEIFEARGEWVENRGVGTGKGAETKDILRQKSIVFPNTLDIENEKKRSPKLDIYFQVAA